MSERRLGSRYVLTDPLGQGGMGQVWRGVDDEGREWAIKLLLPELTSDPKVVQRFFAERQHLRGVRDPHVVGVHDLVAEGDTFGIVMDLVRGGDLRDLLQAEGPFAPARIARLGAGIAQGLAAVHRQGIVHRDIKPANVMVVGAGTDEERPLITDFGIARLADAASGVTTTGNMIGTPLFVAPEIIENHPPQPASDLYSFGVMLYQLCVGVPPFVARTTVSLLRMHTDVVPARPPGVPDPLWALIERLLDKDPSRRGDASSVAAQLRGLVPQLEGLPAAPRLAEPPQGRPVSRPYAAPPPPVRMPGSTEPWPDSAPTVPTRRVGQETPVAPVGTGPSAGSPSGPVSGSSPSPAAGGRGLKAAYAGAAALVLVGGGLLVAKGLGGGDEAAQPPPTSQGQTTTTSGDGSSSVPPTSTRPASAPPSTGGAGAGGALTDFPVQRPTERSGYTGPMGLGAGSYDVAVQEAKASGGTVTVTFTAAGPSDLFDPRAACITDGTTDRPVLQFNPTTSSPTRYAGTLTFDSKGLTGQRLEFYYGCSRNYSPIRISP